MKVQVILCSKGHITIVPYYVVSLGKYSVFQVEDIPHDDNKLAYIQMPLANIVTLLPL